MLDFLSRVDGACVLPALIPFLHFRRVPPASSCLPSCLSSLSASCLPPPPFLPRASQSSNPSTGSPSTPPCTMSAVRTCFEAACTRYRYPGYPFLSHIFYYFQAAAAIKAGIDKSNASKLGARTLPPSAHVPLSCERLRRDLQSVSCILRTFVWWEIWPRAFFFRHPFGHAATLPKGLAHSPACVAVKRPRQTGPLLRF